MIVSKIREKYSLLSIGGKTTKIILKIVGSSIVLTLVNYAVSLFGQKALHQDVMGMVVFAQSYLTIALQICISGYNTEILRCGTLERYRKGHYGITRRALIKILLVTFLYIIVSYSLFDTMNGLHSLILVFPLINILVYIYLSGAVLRSMQFYIISNVIDKFIVTSTSVSILFLLAFEELNIYLIFAIYLCLSILTLTACLLIIHRIIPLKALLVSKNIYDDRGIRNNLYLGSVLMLVVLELQNIFIAEKSSLTQLAEWNAYLLLFFPFKFFARNVHQVLFPELASARFTFNKLNITKYVLLVIAVSIFIFLIGVFPYAIYFEDKYNISVVGVCLVVILGCFHMLYSPIGVMLGSRGSSRILLYNNIWAILISVLVLVFYYYYVEFMFPYLLLIVLASYWMLKCLFGLILVRKIVHE